MEILYGKGEYIQGNRRFSGKILLGEYKLNFKDDRGDISATYIPLEKIERIKKTFKGLQIYVRLSAATGYCALIKPEKRNTEELISELVKRLHLKKQFLRKEWTGEISWR